MEVRITFRSEVFFEVDTLEEIKNKWESLPIFSADALENNGAEIIEVTSVEDTSTYEDIMGKINCS